MGAASGLNTILGRATSLAAEVRHDLQFEWAAVSLTLSLAQSCGSGRQIGAAMGTAPMPDTGIDGARDQCRRQDQSPCEISSGAASRQHTTAQRHDQYEQYGPGGEENLARERNLCPAARMRRRSRNAKLQHDDRFRRKAKSNGTAGAPPCIAAMP